MDKDSNRGYSSLELIAGGVGVSPLPILGEVCLTAFIYRTLKDSPFGEKKASVFIESFE